MQSTKVIENNGEKITCYTCHQKGHTSQECMKRKRSQNNHTTVKKQKDFMCFHCMEMGHVATYCPKKGKTPGVGSKRKSSGDVEEPTNKRRKVDVDNKKREGDI